MWRKNNAINHPPVITIFIGGIPTIPKWVVYGIVLPHTLVSKKCRELTSYNHQPIGNLNTVKIIPPLAVQDGGWKSTI